MAERRYNEAELAAILRAAADAQSSSASPSDEPGGYSLAEIERLASEVGIDPKHIASAADNLSSLPQAKPKFLFWGAPMRQTIERNYEGTIDNSSWEESVAELRNAFGSTGTAGVVGSSREWSGGHDFRLAHLVATPKSGRTRLRLTVNIKDMLAVAWMVGIILTILATALAGTLIYKSGFKPMVPFGCTVVALLSYISINRIVTKWTAGTMAIAESLMDKIEGLTPKSIPVSMTQVPTLLESETPVTVLPG